MRHRLYLPQKDEGLVTKQIALMKLLQELIRVGFYFEQATDKANSNQQFLQ
jgi:hypothetical protein